MKTGVHTPGTQRVDWHQRAALCCGPTLCLPARIGTCTRCVPTEKKCHRTLQPHTAQGAWVHGFSSSVYGSNCPLLCPPFLNGRVAWHFRLYMPLLLGPHIVALHSQFRTMINPSGIACCAKGHAWASGMVAVAAPNPHFAALNPHLAVAPPIMNPASLTCCAKGHSGASGMVAMKQVTFTPWYVASVPSTCTQLSTSNSN